jgi:integrase
VKSLLTAASLPAGRDDDERAARFWAAIDDKFLAVVGWDPDWRVVTFPLDHPLLGQKVCRIPGCHNPGRQRNGFCRGCEGRLAHTPGVSLAEFAAMPKPIRRCIGLVPCAVGGCRRSAKSTRAKLCNAHEYQRASMFCLSLEEFLARPEVVPLASFGPCSAAACTRDRDGHGPYCRQHRNRLRLAKKKDPGLDVGAWARTVPAVAEGLQVSLRGLPELVVAEVLYGLQERTRADIKTDHIRLRPVCDLLRRTQVASVADVDRAELVRHNRELLGSAVKWARRLEMSPETERHKDEWDLFVFGHAGSMSFTGISQAWLREAVKRWAFDELPRHRGDAVASVASQRVNSVGRLSESLRLQRADHGDVIGALGREDITAFCNRTAFLTEQGQISGHTRQQICRSARLVLNRCRSMGLTRPGQPLHGLPDDFALLPEDIPQEPEEDLAGRDLPAEVMRALTSHLDQLEASTCKEVRVAVELMMDTGRRPDEVASLPLDCLEADPGGEPVLIYDNHKAHRKGRRLPIAAATAAIITGQQERVRARFPGTPDSQLKLLPSSTRNPAGRRNVSDSWVCDGHRAWVSSIPEIKVPAAVEIGGRHVTRMLPFSKEKITPYAYRHTYAQRHADAGVDVTVLQELMDHRELSTTQTYYRNSQELHQMNAFVQVT